VVTHNKRTAAYPTVYTFVTDGVVRAIEQAKHVAGDKVVGLHGATVMQQALPLGLVDEIRVHGIPVLLGGGTPLFATLDSAITLERTQVLVTDPSSTYTRRSAHPAETRHHPLISDASAVVRGIRLRANGLPTRHGRTSTS